MQGRSNVGGSGRVVRGSTQGALDHLGHGHIRGVCENALLGVLCAVPRPDCGLRVFVYHSVVPVPQGPSGWLIHGRSDLFLLDTCQGSDGSGRLVPLPTATSCSSPPTCVVPTLHESEATYGLNPRDTTQNLRRFAPWGPWRGIIYAANSGYSGRQLGCQAGLKDVSHRYMQLERPITYPL